MAARGKRSRRLGRETNVGIEGLERRDCPAVVSIVGPTEVAEAGTPVTFTATLSAAQDRAAAAEAQRDAAEGILAYLSGTDMVRQATDTPEQPLGSRMTVAEP